MTATDTAEAALSPAMSSSLARAVVLVKRVRPKDRAQLAIIVTDDGARVLPRGELAAHLRAADLTEPLHALATRGRPEEIVVWLIGEPTCALVELGRRSRVLWPVSEAEAFA